MRYVAAPGVIMCYPAYVLSYYVVSEWHFYPSYDSLLASIIYGFLLLLYLSGFDIGYILLFRVFFVGFREYIYDTQHYIPHYQTHK